MILVTFLGLYAGVALSYIAPEELKMGKKYFEWILNVLLFLLVVVLLKGFNFYIIPAGIIALMVMPILVKADRKYIYPLLPVVALVSSGSNYFMYAMALIFLYGFPLGSLYCVKYEKKEKLNIKTLDLFKRITIKYGTFLIVSVLFLFI